MNISVHFNTFFNVYFVWSDILIIKRIILNLRGVGDCPMVDGTTGVSNKIICSNNSYQDSHCQKHDTIMKVVFPVPI